MSSAHAVREEDEDENKSSGSGLGIALAVAAVGIGIGATLYHFFKPTSETPHTSNSRHGDQQRNLNYSYNSHPAEDVINEKQILEQEQLNKINEDIYRNRSWTLEPCSICTEEILTRDSIESFMLPCGHKFHVACIKPWVESNDTCPNCRKTI